MPRHVRCWNGAAVFARLTSALLFLLCLLVAGAADAQRPSPIRTSRIAAARLRTRPRTTPPRAMRSPGRARAAAPRVAIQPAAVHRVETLRPSDVIPMLREQLRAIGFRGSRVIVRFFTRGRVQRTRMRGTDRDETSTLFDIPIADSSAATRAEAHVRDTNVTYAHELDLSTDRPRVVMPNGESHDYGDHLAELEEIGGPTLGGAIAVYDPRTLERAHQGPNRQPSLAEFWFRGNPRRSLLFVLERAPDAPRAPR